MVNSLEQLPDDPHLKEVDFWQLHEDPVEGTLRLPTPSVGLSASPAAVRRLPPRLGEHTDEVLTGAGLTPDELTHLADAGITTPVNP